MLRFSTHCLSSLSYSYGQLLHQKLPLQCSCTYTFDKQTVVNMSRYKVFVGHLSPDTRTKDLERFFKDHGFSRSIVEVVVKDGYGFVNFDDRRDADDAIYELNGKELHNSRLAIEYAKPSGRSEGGGRFGGRGGFQRPYSTDFRIIIENLSTRASWQDLKDFFRQAGEVTFAKCHRERMGEGLVEFATAKDMHNAMRKLNDAELNGKRIKLRLENKEHELSRSRSRSPVRRGQNSGGRSRSRSPHQRNNRRSPSSESRSPTPR